MSQNRYFTKITSDYYVAKNKLQAEAKQVAIVMERQIIDEDYILTYFYIFDEKIKALNLKYKRCNPLVLEKRECVHNEVDIRIEISGVFYMKLYLIKE